MSNTYSQVYFHLVWGTKGRANLIPSAYESELYRYIGGVCRKKDAFLMEIGEIADHVHLLVNVPLRVGMPDLVRQIKTGSAKWFNAKPTINDFHWQEGYGAFSVSRSSVPQVQHYIQRQKEHHATVSFEQEYLALLRKHGVSFDERYVLG